MTAESALASTLTLSLALTSCAKETVFVDSSAFSLSDFVVAITTEGDGTPIHVWETVDLRTNPTLNFELEPERELWFVGFRESELPFPPLSPIRAELTRAPPSPVYALGEENLSARLPPPTLAASWRLEADGSIRSGTNPELRAKLSLGYDYAEDPPGRLVPFAATPEFVTQVRVRHREYTGRGLGRSERVEQLLWVSDSRLVLLQPQLLMIVDQNHDEPARPFSPDQPTRWYPATLVDDDAGANFLAAQLAPRARPDGSRTLYVVGRTSANEGRVWSFRLGRDGASFDGAIPFLGSQPAPSLDLITVDQAGTVLVAGDDAFLAIKAETSSVFRPDGDLLEYLRSASVASLANPELTFLGHRTETEPPHVVGLDVGWVVEGDATLGRWQKVVDLREVSGDVQNIHVLSHVESPEGEAWVSTRHGHLFRRRPGEPFRELPLLPARALAACTDQGAKFTHHLRDFALLGAHGFTVNRNCSALLRVRLEDGFVSPIFIDDETVATTITSTSAGLDCGVGGDARYFVGGYPVRLDYSSSD